MWLVRGGGGSFNFDFPVGGGGHVNKVDYSHKGTASILFDFPNVAGVWGGGGGGQTPFTEFPKFSKLLRFLSLSYGHSMSLLIDTYKIAFIHFFICYTCISTKLIIN